MNDKFRMWLNTQLRNRSWSQNELARRSGVSQSMISMVMSGKAKPGLEFLQGVAGALNVPLEAVLREADVLPSVREKFIDEVTDVLKQMTIEEREYIYELAKLHYRRNHLRAGDRGAIEDPSEP